MTTKQKWDPKDPEDIADYWFDCTDFLLETGETITNAEVTAPAEIDISITDWSGPTGTQVRVRLGGGVDGEAYDHIAIIDTSSGERFRMRATLLVANRIIKQ